MLKKKMDLRVKLLTLPFTEIEFYYRDIIEELSRYGDLKRYDAELNKILMNSIYTVINKRLNINNLDELKLLFRCYYDKAELDEKFITYNNVSKFYMDHLSSVSKIFLTHRNGKIALKYWKTNDEDELLGPYSGIYKIALWNSMNRMFTTDLLVMQYLLDNEMDEEYYLLGYHSLVDIQDLQLEQVLSQGVAETHIHLNAGGDFIVIWQDLMSLAINKDSYRYKKKEKMQDWDKIIGKSFGLKSYIKAMAILRILLAYFLKIKAINNEETTFELFYKNNTLGLNESIDDFINSIYNGKKLDENSFSYEDMYDTIKDRLQIRDVGKQPASTSWSNYLAKKDILNDIINMEDDYTTVENIFLFRSFKYMRSNGKDAYFSKLFWQYIRVKNEVFQLKVQGNAIKGLDNFKEYYNRSKDLSYEGKDSLGLILHTQLNNYNLKKIELRLGFPSDKNNNEDRIRKNLIENLKIFFDVYKELAKDLNDQQREIPAIGLIYHFLKRSDPTGIEKCWLENEDDSFDLYFKSVQETYKAQLNVLNKLREKVDGLADYIVGIDAASGENDTEPWVFAPLYEIARNSDSHKPVYKAKPHKRIRNLGFTFHAGEDFRHILTGLRRIDEVIRQFKFHAGDRIGHAIALGINVKRWAFDNKVVILPRIEYLENLLWIWGLHKDGNVLENLDNAYLEQKILSQAEKIYINMTGITVFNLWKAYQSKFKIFNKDDKYNYITIKDNPNIQNELFCKNISNDYTITWTEEKLAHAQHCKCYLKGMLKPIQVEVTEADIMIIESIQKLVAKNISREGIVIEVNPTSNTSIGQVKNIFEHYVANLNKHGLCNTKVENGIMVTINTDDPSVFNTNINNEFAYIFYSLKEKGYAREDILNWIDKVRKNGINSSFIETRCISNGERIRELQSIINKLDNL